MKLYTAINKSPRVLPGIHNPHDVYLAFWSPRATPALMCKPQMYKYSSLATSAIRKLKLYIVNPAKWCGGGSSPEDEVV